MMPKPNNRLHSIGGAGHILVMISWFWTVNLIIFPTWLFVKNDPIERLQTVSMILLWIIISSFILWSWLHIVTRQSRLPWQALAPNPKQLSFLFILLLIAGMINFIPITYPLTSSGDEVHHASVFRTMGRIIALLLPQFPSFILLLFSLIGFTGIGIAWWQLAQSNYRNLTLFLTTVSLIIIVIISILVLPKYIEAAFSIYEPAQLRRIVRFEPLSKFIWLPVSICCWDSVMALRLPVWISWLLATLVMYRTISLREQSLMALLPALFLLTLPGMFYFGHLVYLTTPMLLFWCIVLYFHECYQLSNDRKYLIWTALALNIGTFVRAETAYFTLGILAYYGLSSLRKCYTTGIESKILVDGAGLAWFGLSFIPLWQYISPQRSFMFNSINLLELKRLVSIINDYPFHIGPVATLILLFAIGALLVKRGRSYYSSSLLAISVLTIGISYILYTIDYIISDPRMIGVIEFGREWQTSHRFLVSWSPFIAILLAEGIAHLPWSRWRLTFGMSLALLLLAQATILPLPLTLPEFTTIRIQPNVEYPHLPDAEVVTYISNTLAKTDKKIFMSGNLGAVHYRNSISTKNHWVIEQLMPKEKQTIENFITYCKDEEIDLVVLPLVWMEGLSTKLEISKAILVNDNFKVHKIFNYLDKPGIVVAEYIGNKVD